MKIKLKQCIEMEGGLSETSRVCAADKDIPPWHLLPRAAMDDTSVFPPGSPMQRLGDPPLANV